MDLTPSTVVHHVPFAFPGLPEARCAFLMRGPAHLHAASPGVAEMLERDPFGTQNISFDVGDSPASVEKVRARVRGWFGFAHWLETRQVHGDRILFDPAPVPLDQPGFLPADGMATDRPGRALVIKSADCQPILLAHKGGKHIAALHAGWRGNRLAFPTSGTRAFCEHYNLDPADVLAVRGPSLGPERSEFTNFDEEWGNDFQGYYDPDRKTVDMWRMTRDQLQEAGLKPENIYSLDLCTRSLPHAFFSFRASRACGRQAALIWL